MSLATGGAPSDADRWLYLHEDEVVGAPGDSAVNMVREAGLRARVSSMSDGPQDPAVQDPSRIRLFVEDGRVMADRWG